MKETYKYSLWNHIENLGWLIIPIPASGAGKKGIHRPDLIIANGKKLYVAEVKNSKFPLYLNIEKDINPIINYAKALCADPIVILKKKFSKTWLIFEIKDLEKCSDKSYVVNNKNIIKGKILNEYLRTKPN